MEVTGWAPEHSDALREYFANGMSFAKIARAINAKFQTSYSRNAAIGRAKRLGLLGQEERSSPPRLTPVPQLQRSSEPRASEPRLIEWYWPPPAFEKGLTGQAPLRRGRATASFTGGTRVRGLPLPVRW
jgi:GcrA cell cycle regulator